MSPWMELADTLASRAREGNLITGSNPVGDTNDCGVDGHARVSSGDVIANHDGRSCSHGADQADDRYRTLQGRSRFRVRSVVYVLMAELADAPSSEGGILSDM